MMPAMVGEPTEDRFPALTLESEAGQARLAPFFRWGRL
jgi:hypothetical protein